MHLDNISLINHMRINYTIAIDAEGTKYVSLFIEFDATIHSR